MYRSTTVGIASVAIVLLAVLGVVVHGNNYQVSEHPEVVMHHSLHPPFITDWWQGGLPHWDFGSAAVVTDHYIRLTPDKQSRHGWVWNEQANDLASWQVSFGFRVHSTGTLGADGMAFWYVEHPQRGGGPVFGMPYGFRGLGVGFDTYDNDGQRDNPSVLVFVDDGSPHARYNSGNDFANDQKGKCIFDFRGGYAPTDVAQARIVYTDSEQRVEVYMKMGDRAETLCATVTGVKLPTGYYFGATAETGHVADNHDVHYLHVTPPPGVVLDHDPYNVPQQVHLPHDVQKDKEERHYWRAKTPEEKAAEEAAEKARIEEIERKQAENERKDKEQAPAAPEGGEEEAPADDANTQQGGEGSDAAAPQDDQQQQQPEAQPEEAPQEPPPPPPPTRPPVPPPRNPHRPNPQQQRPKAPAPAPPQQPQVPKGQPPAQPPRVVNGRQPQKQRGRPTH
eukprot:PhF_6_TR12904/c1_g1_i2/m.20331